MKKWFLSDTHFSHEAIIRYCERPFKSAKEMDQTLIENWNRKIGKEDLVFFLGDFGLGSVEDLKKIANQLNGQKICIRGNHDNAEKMYALGFLLVVEALFIRIGKYRVELIHIPTDPPPTHFQLHGHVHHRRPKSLVGYQCNVSVEPWNYSPISEDELLSQFEASYLQPVEINI